MCHYLTRVILLSPLPRRSGQLECLSYLGKPQKVLHEGIAVGVLHLHDGYLILSSHQQTVLMIKHCRYVDPPRAQAKAHTQCMKDYPK